ANRVVYLLLDVNIRDVVRREYLLLGPCQPKGHIFPKKRIGDRQRSFQESCHLIVCHMCYQISSIARGNFLEIFKSKFVIERFLGIEHLMFLRMYLEEDLVELAQIYVDDFTEYDCIIQVSYHTDRHTVFPLVYRLIELALILPVATATMIGNKLGKFPPEQLMAATQESKAFDISCFIKRDALLKLSQQHQHGIMFEILIGIN
ncbi:hypothetical protein ACJX0J_032329, partial [Zea mays]